MERHACADLRMPSHCPIQIPTHPSLYGLPVVFVKLAQWFEVVARLLRKPTARPLGDRTLPRNDHSSTLLTTETKSGGAAGVRSIIMGIQCQHRVRCPR